jgi:hypothetical protein
VFYNFAQDGISSLNGQSRLNWCSGLKNSLSPKKATIWFQPQISVS